MNMRTSASAASHGALSNSHSALSLPDVTVRRASSDAQSNTGLEHRSTSKPSQQVPEGSTMSMLSGRAVPKSIKDFKQTPSSKRERERERQARSSAQSSCAELGP